MIVDKIWKLTNTVRVTLAPRSSQSQRQTTFQDNVCSFPPPVTDMGECQRQKGQDYSDDTGGKSVSEKSKSNGGTVWDSDGNTMTLDACSSVSPMTCFSQVGKITRGREGERETDRMRTQYHGSLWGIKYDVVDVFEGKSQTTTVTVWSTISCRVRHKLFFQCARHPREGTKDRNRIS